MNTLGNKTKRVIVVNESYSIHYKATAGEPLKTGDVVKIDTASKKVVKVTAATDEVFGIVISGCREKDTNVTLNTQFVAIMEGIADGELAYGDKVAVTGKTTDGETKYKKAVTGNFVTGIALGKAADTKGVRVGILRMFNKI